MKAFNFLRKQRGQSMSGEHHQGWGLHRSTEFDPSSDTLCSDPFQPQNLRGRAVHSVYGNLPPAYYGVSPGYPHPEVMLRVVPGMAMPAPGLDSRFYQGHVDMMHDHVHQYAPPTGANLAAGESHSRSFNPHPINTGPHPRNVSSGDPPHSATSPVGPGWSPTRMSTERHFPVATTFTLADYESLRRYDLVFLVCNTPSMSQNGKWQQCGELLTQLTRVAMEYDSDGVDIHFLNTDSERSEQTFTSEEDVQEIFQRVNPSGGFRISDKLDPLMKAYRSQLQEYIDTSKPARRWLTAHTPKRAIFVVLTDGNYSDGDNLKSHIVKMAQYLDEINAPDTQFGIQFVQIGEGNEFFEWLDREMYVNEKVRDIVRTDKYRGGTLDEFQLGALLLGSVSGNASS